MTDVEKARKELKGMASYFHRRMSDAAIQKDRDQFRRYENTCAAASALLDSREPKEAVTDNLRNWRCPVCGTVLKGRFCHECGQAIQKQESNQTEKRRRLNKNP